MKSESNSMTLLMVSGITLLLMHWSLTGCSRDAQSASTGNPEAASEHFIAYTVWLEDEHQVIVQDDQEILNQVEVGSRPVRLLSGDRNDLSVEIRADSGLVRIAAQKVEALLDPSFPQAYLIGWFADGAMGFDMRQMRVWRWDFDTEEATTILDRETLVRLLKMSPDIEKNTYLGRLAVSPSGASLALTVPGDELLYAQSQDWTSEVYVVSTDGEKATSLGLGMPLFWLDEHRLMVWNIETGTEGRRFVARLFSSDGRMLAEQDQVGSIAWNGRFLYIVRVDPKEGYSKRFDKPIVEVWDEGMKVQLSSFQMQTEFVNAYSSNFIAF